jgi:hypothetical protein
MSKKSNKKTTNKWRWQLDLLLFLLITSIILWTVTKIQVIDMSRITQAYLPPIEEPQGLATNSQDNNWLETEQAVTNPLIKKSEEQQAETAQTIAEEQEATIVASVTKPKADKQLENWREIESKDKPETPKPKPNYVTSTEKIDKKAALTPEDQLF